MQQLKLEKIEYQPEFFTKCICCGKPLKKAYYTNAGTYGIDCFLAAIGLPRVRAQKASPVLPAEQYDNLAEQMIQAFTALTDEQIIQIFVNYHECKILSVERRWTMFRFKYTDCRGTERTEECNIIILHQWFWEKVMSLPADMYKPVMGSKRFNDFYHESCRFWKEHCWLIKIA